jgi:predicted nucleic acid-binding protein
VTGAGFLIDTNVISEVRKRRPDRNVIRWFRTAPADRLYLSVLVTGEIRQGIERLRPREPARAETLDAWLDQLHERFTDRILPVSPPVADRWGRLNAIRPLPVVDGLLAATALAHNLTLATRNADDVAGLGLDVVDPWKG